MSKSVIVNSRDHHRQHLTRQHRGCPSQIRPEWLGRHLLPLDLHWCTFLPSYKLWSEIDWGAIGFLIIYAKFSDIFGRKHMLLIALVLFTVFSIACGLANNMLEL